MAQTGWARHDYTAAMAHWDLFLPDDTVCEARLIADASDELAEPAQVPLRVLDEVVRLAKQSELALLARLPVLSGASCRYAQSELAGLEQEWAALVEELRDARTEEAMDPLLALARHGLAHAGVCSLEVRTP
jgi:hypothetical protein